MISHTSPALNVLSEILEGESGIKKLCLKALKSLRHIVSHC